MPAVPRRVAAVVLLTSVLVVASVAQGAARRNLVYDLPQDTLERFDFSVSSLVETALVRLPAEADRYDLEPLRARLASVQTTLSGTLERFVGRAFRDDSLGVIARLVDLDGTLARGGEPVGLDVTGLEGKSVSLRLHDSGELLDSVGWDHLSGAMRGHDVVAEVLLQQVLRLPATAPRGSGAVGATFKLRFSVDSSLQRTWDHVLSWTLADPGDCRGCLALAYEGPLMEKVRDKHPARPMVMDGQGRVEGVVLLDRGGRSRPLLRHEWTTTWTRKVRSERDNGSMRGEVEQTVTTHGRIQRKDEP